MKSIVFLLMACISLNVYSCDFLGINNQDEILPLSKNIYIGSVVGVKSEDYGKYVANTEPFQEIDSNFFKHGASRKVLVVVRKTLKGKPLKSIYYNIDKDDTCSVLNKGELYDTVVIYENDNSKLGRPIQENEYKELVSKF